MSVARGLKGVEFVPSALLTLCRWRFTHLPQHTSKISQATAGQYLKAGKMSATLARMRKVYGESAQVMADALKREMGDAVTFIQPEGGLVFWARLTGVSARPKDAGELAKRAIEKGVAFVPRGTVLCERAGCEYIPTVICDCRMCGIRAWRASITRRGRMT